MLLRFQLVDSAPTVAREVVLEGSTTLDVVHLVVQRLYGWQNVHMHRFDSADPYQRQRTDAPEPRSWLLPSLLDEFDGEPDSDTTVGEALEVSGGTLWYEYDFGDGWQVTITVLDATDSADSTAAVTDATGHGPGDDLGGVHTFNELRKVVPIGGIAPVDRDALDAEVKTLLAATRALAHLRPLLTRVTTDVGTQWCERVASAVANPPVIDDVAIAASVRPFQRMLRRIGPDGIALTGAGWLPPALVRDAMHELGWEHRAFGMMNREDRTPAIAELRATMRHLGLLRVAKGRITVTAMARRLVDDPIALWRYVAEQVVARAPSDADRDLQLLLAVHLVAYRAVDRAVDHHVDHASGRDVNPAAGRALNNGRLAAWIAEGLTTLGWHDRGGPDAGFADPRGAGITLATAESMLRDALQPLGDLGAFTVGVYRWYRGDKVTEVGRALGYTMLGGVAN